jgi:hypothetical protein
MPTPPTLPYLRPIFHEEQQFRGGKPFVIMLVVFALVIAFTSATFMAVGAIPKRLVFILALPILAVMALMFATKLTTIVDAAGVHVRFIPFVRKTFALDDIVAWQAKTYDPIEYGGWGVRGFPGRYGWAYNVSGNRGVELEFKNGNRLMLGSQRADELARAIDEAKGTTA